MKEIKFKAWNIIEKVMVDWATLKANPLLFMGIATGEVKYYKLLQFTGIKDNNGTDIYDGDIVRDVCYSKEINKRGSFYYSEANCCWDVTNRSDDRLGAISFIEVIGNIHQNPELLK